MALTLAAIFVVVLSITYWIRRASSQRELEDHSISPEALHTLMASKQDLLLFDVRQPLDLLADSEMIPGATRLAPRELIHNPGLILKDKDSVVYCTCPSDKTSRAILHRALAMGYLQVRFLKGGLVAWKAMGYPVEPYEKSFHLDTA